MSPSTASELYRLQVIDLDIARHRARLKEIEALMADDAELTLARDGLAAAENALKPWKTRARDLDLEIRSLAQKIETTDKHLYSGKVRNPKEMQDMQEEIASLKRRHSQLEDELLEAMLQNDEKQALVLAAQQTMSRLEAARTESMGTLRAEKERLEQALTTLEAQRKRSASGINREDLAIYDSLRAKRHGHAVALLQGDTCMGCRVEQTSNVVHHARQEKDLVFCESCGRILAIQ